MTDAHDPRLTRRLSPARTTSPVPSAGRILPRVTCRGLTMACVALLLTTAVVHAHPDEPVVDATLRLAPGEIVAIPMAVHYHRLVARYRTHPADAPGATLRVIPAGSTPAGDAVAGGAAAGFEARLGGAGRLHHLIDCCLARDDAAYELWLSNEGGAPLELDVRAWLVHDEFAVIAHRAEPGALEAPLMIFLGLGGAALLATSRRRQRHREPGGAAGGATRARGSLAFAWSFGSFVAACVMALGLGVAGMARYGTGLAAGSMAIMADVPLPGGPFGSRGSVAMGVLLLVWMASLALWTLAIHRGAHLRSPWPVRMVLAVAAVGLIAAVTVGWDYGRWAVPLGLGAVLVLPLSVSARWLMRLEAGTRPGGGWLRRRSAQPGHEPVG
jgi:hypothetical protein